MYKQLHLDGSGLLIVRSLIYTEQRNGEINQALLISSIWSWLITLQDSTLKLIVSFQPLFATIYGLTLCILCFLCNWVLMENVDDFICACSINVKVAWAFDIKVSFNAGHLLQPLLKLHCEIPCTVAELHESHK